MNELNAEPYGFQWGQVRVTRIGSIERRGGVYRIVQVEAGWDENNNKVEIYVSPTGRSMRVFKNGRELA